MDGSPCIPIVITMRGVIFQPCTLIAFTNGLYLSSFVCMFVTGIFFIFLFLSTGIINCTLCTPFFLVVTGPRRCCLGHSVHIARSSYHK